jgi:hypothetical protein
MSTCNPTTRPSETTLHLSAWLVTEFSVLIKHGTIGDTPRKVIQGRALPAQSKTALVQCHQRLKNTK